MREVQTIKAKKRLARKRVAAYVRVSTAKDAMIHSFDAQKDYYVKLIKSRYDWMFSGIYADEGITGTKDKRPGFQAMLTDCRKGKIEMILTKSISRFARNTVDLLTSVRALKEMSVDVYFEEQNIHTLSADGELMLTILASYAQEESLSTSENTKWSIRKAFENGELRCMAHLFGYRFRSGKVTVEASEAEDVRWIFSEYVGGRNIVSIARGMNARRDEKGWTAMAIRRILSNEKYTGDALLQKSYVNNYLEKKQLPNTGELSMYYAEETHPAIISREMFERAQERLESAKEKKAKENTAPKSFSPYTGKLVCGYCGAYCKRVKNHGRTIWRCHNAVDAIIRCQGKQIREDELEEILQGRSVERVVVWNDKLDVDGETEMRRKKSRSDSWTEEMREEARTRVKEQWRKVK